MQLKNYLFNKNSEEDEVLLLHVGMFILAVNILQKILEQ